MLFELLESLRARLLTTSTLSQETTREGQTLVNGFFTSTNVDTTPAFVLDDNLSRLFNFGEIATNNAASAVSVEAEDVDVFNFRNGRIEANNGPETQATGVDVTGSADVRNFGEISGDFNGVSFSGAESSGRLDNFRGGVISSDSRAVNVQGEGVSIRNLGEILGTGDQRNGTVYTNSTVEDFTLSNFFGGKIDAGEGNNGAGVSLEVGDQIGDVVSNTIFNGFGSVIQGRGQADASTGLAGDGIRINNGAEGAVSSTNIENRGLISSESTQGTTAGIRIADGVAAEGRVLNTHTGVIEGAQNGLYVGNAEHDLNVQNFGTIQSGSRAVNIDGTGVDLLNAGAILGIDDQRNGTVYADGTADDFSVENSLLGTIDAGEHNQGSGFGAEIGGAADGANTFKLENAGTIEGRGDAGASTNQAGDGVRIGNIGNQGTTDATITNSGEILSEGANGTVAGLRVVNNINFQGSLVNEEGGLIAGAQNGVYFGTGDHSGGTFVNEGLVSSGSRAVNIDGEGLAVVNDGQILGTGDQRNGTVYADGTAEDYSFTNTGLVDAGIGNNGSAVSLQTGDVDGDSVGVDFLNVGTLQGRGDAIEGNTVGDGLRLFTNQEDAFLFGLFENEGVIAGSEDSDVAVGIRIDGGLDFRGVISNQGEITGSVNAIDATDAAAATFVNLGGGVVNGNVLLSDGSDIVLDLGRINGVIDGGAGDDALIAGDGDNVLVGGLGNDFLDGGQGNDTADFSDLDVSVTVDLGASGNGTAVRETGFSVSVNDAAVSVPASFVAQALADELYYNIHTSEFLGGEIRGQLLVQSEATKGDIRTIELSGELDASQEPGPSSDSEATGVATLTITENLVTGEVTYSSELSVSGLSEADLQTPGAGGVSAIHVHTAPAGVNGPIVQDTLVDAGGTLDATTNTGVTEDVIAEVSETDVLSSIENVVGSDDADVIFGSDQANSLNGGDGDDVIRGEGGRDILTGGLGADIFEFSTLDGHDVVTDFQIGVDDIRLTGFGPDFDVASAVASARQDGADAVLSFGSDTSVRLQNIDVAQLNEHDFIF